MGTLANVDIEMLFIYAKESEETVLNKVFLPYFAFGLASTFEYSEKMS